MVDNQRLKVLAELPIERKAGSRTDARPRARGDEHEVSNVSPADHGRDARRPHRGPRRRRQVGLGAMLLRTGQRAAGTDPQRAQVELSPIASRRPARGAPTRSPVRPSPRRPLSVRARLYVTAVIASGLGLLVYVAVLHGSTLVRHGSVGMWVLVGAVVVGELRPDQARHRRGRGRPVDHLHLRAAAVHGPGRRRHRGGRRLRAERRHRSQAPLAQRVQRRAVRAGHRRRRRRPLAAGVLPHHRAASAPPTCRPSSPPRSSSSSSTRASSPAPSR